MVRFLSQCLSQSVRRFAPAVLALAAAWLAAASPAGAVVGASEDGSAYGGFVVMVLQRKGSEAGFCSGIVLRRDVVLTAAHCVPPGAALRVHYRDAGGSPVLVDVAAVERHPGYRAQAVARRERSVDAALLRLASPLPASFAPAQLVAAPPESRTGTAFRLLGYGVTREGEGGSSGKLRLGRVALRDPHSQLLLWASDPSGRGIGACEGDSGGPVLAEGDDKVVALTVWASGEGAARCGALTQALWIGAILDWADAGLARWGQ